MAIPINIYQQPHQGGIVVRELSWEESGWDELAAGSGQRGQAFPTLVDWRLCLTGALSGQLLHHPSMPYGCVHRTARIMEVRRLCARSLPVAFAADGQTYRLGAPRDEVQSACRGWLDMMLGEGPPLPAIVHRVPGGAHDLFGGRRAH